MNLLYDTYRIRLIEEAIEQIYPTDKIQSPVHLSNGQEAISVGVCAHLIKTDLVFGTYRGHALYLAKGGCLKKMMAELFGKQTGCGKGKAGSMHLSAKEVGMMGTSAIVSSTIAHAVGAAYAAKMRSTGQVIVCFFGEGATGEGAYHESLNFASKHNLPILFVCENNGYAIFTKVSKTHAYQVCEHAAVYGIPAQYMTEESWEVEKIYACVGEELEQIKRESHPRLIEIQTFRYKQHVGPGEDFHLGDRSKKEFEKWCQHDPLGQNSEELQGYRQQIEAEIIEAIRFAENTSFPSQADLYEDVY